MNKSLVAFFSATGTTKKTAELIASAANADLYEILPKIPYSASDLDWMDNHSRSSMEMKDKTYRPELADSNLSLEHYDKIFLGFPIWWYVAPTLINTFPESYDFSGKKIILRHIRRQRIWKYQKRASVFRTGRHFNRRKIMQSYVQKRN